MIAIDSQTPFALSLVEGLPRGVSICPPRSPFENLRVTGLLGPTVKPEEPHFQICYQGGNHDG